MIEVCIPLYGPPLLELWDGSEKICPIKLQERAYFLQLHLFRVSYAIKKLQRNGWILAADQTVYVLVYQKDLSCREDVLTEMNRLHIPDDLYEVYEVRSV